LVVDTAATAPLPDHLMADTTEDRLMAVTEAATKRHTLVTERRSTTRVRAATRASHS